MSIGERLRSWRLRRGMTQQELADTAGVSLGVVRKLEQGERQSARLDTLTSLANAVDAPITDLIGRPRGLLANAENGEVGKIRQALLGIVGQTEHHLDPAQLSAAPDQMWRLYWKGSYGTLARALPRHIDAARTADHPALGEVLQVTGALLCRLAHEDLAHLAWRDALQAHAHHGDDIGHAAVQAARTWGMTVSGLWPEVETLALTTAESIEPKFQSAPAERVAVWADLMKYAAIAMSSTGRHDEAREIIQLLHGAAARPDIDQRRWLGTEFNPTVVQMREVDAASAADKYDEALRLAQRVTNAHKMQPAMQVWHLLNVAWAQVETWRSAEAVNTLLRAESIGPEAFTHMAVARTAINELLPRRRKQRLPGLSALARRTGVPVLT